VIGQDGGDRAAGVPYEPAISVVIRVAPAMLPSAHGSAPVEGDRTMDQEKVEALAFRVIGEMAASFSMALGHIGDRLGLFRTLADAGPVTSEQLASKTGLNERYVREWLKAMVAAEYIDWDPITGRFLMTAEQEFVLANDDAPLSAGGLLQFTTATVLNTPRVIDAFRSGGGVPYAEMGDDVNAGLARLFGPGHTHSLVSEWLAAVPGLAERLARGIHVADVGCGRGLSTVTMAAAYPRSRFLGIDNDPGSIDRARRLAADRHVRNVHWVAAPAHHVPAVPTHDLICAFDCIHAMVDPRATLRAIRAALAEDGVCLWSEPNASDNPLENRNPVGKAFACASPLHSLTVSLAHDGEGLGATIGERGVRELAAEAGFAGVEKLPIQSALSQLFALRK
jgi:SAM-dependent methyltransferase